MAYPSIPCDEGADPDTFGPVLIQIDDVTNAQQIARLPLSECSECPPVVLTTTLQDAPDRQVHQTTPGRLEYPHRLQQHSLPLTRCPDEITSSFPENTMAAGKI
jgi:hypothetical protein